MWAKLNWLVEFFAFFSFLSLSAICYILWFFFQWFYVSSVESQKGVMMFKDVRLRTRRVMSLYSLWRIGDSALLVLNRTSLNSINVLLTLSWRYWFIDLVSFEDNKTFKPHQIIQDSSYCQICKTNSLHDLSFRPHHSTTAIIVKYVHF